MRLLKILTICFICFMILVFCKVADALPVYGRPVVGIGDPNSALGSGYTYQDYTEGNAYFHADDGEIQFYIPLSAKNSGIFGVTIVDGGKTAGTFADTGSGTDSALTMYLLFSPVECPAASASLEFLFTDLDLRYVNDPYHFFETVQFFDDDGIALSPKITEVGQSSGSTDPFVFTVTGNSNSQTITFPDITSIIQDPFYVELIFGSKYISNATNTPESLTATLTTTPAIPEPETLLLLGACLIGLGLFRRRKLTKK